MQTRFLDFTSHPSKYPNKPHIPLSQDWLWIGFGWLFAIDGVLQAKPDMFTSDFYALYPESVMPSLLQQAAQNQPIWLQVWMLHGIKWWGTHPILFNTISILVELGIGGMMLLGKGRHLGYAAVWTGAVWSLIVWVFGQGLGNLLVPPNNFLTGAPGSAVFYFTACLLLLCPARWTRRCVSVLKFSLLSGIVAQIVAQALPSTRYWSGTVMMGVFANAASLHQPTWTSAPISNFALWVVHDGNYVNFAMIVIMILFLIFLSRRTWKKPLLLVTITWLAWLWWFTEDFGGVFSGLSPDIGNAPPLAILFIYVFYGQKESQNAR